MELYDPRGGGQAIRIESLRRGDNPFDPAHVDAPAVNDHLIWMILYLEDGAEGGNEI